MVTNCDTSSSGNKHIFTIIDHLTGRPEAFPIPDKSADTIETTLINEYLPVHMCPQYILSDNGTRVQELPHGPSPATTGEFIEFSLLHTTPRVMANWKFSHKYLKPTLKKLCEKDPTNLDKYLNQVLASYRITPNLATAESPFFPHICQRPQPTNTSTSGTHATFSWRS